VQHLSETGRLGRFYIDGVWREPDGRDRAGVVNPATEAVIAEIPLGSRTDVERAVSAARRAFPGWSRTPPAERATLLGRVHALVLERSDLIAQALTAEMGAAITYARRAQVPLAAEHLRVARDNLAEFPFVSQRGTTAILREAIGVCSLMTPWNWPLYQITANVGQRWPQAARSS
jgi:acyl-CoA reductase-like NAD-dependent aldehyde dehydrogenase